MATKKVKDENSLNIDVAENENNIKLAAENEQQNKTTKNKNSNVKKNKEDAKQNIATKKISKKTNGSVSTSNSNATITSKTNKKRKLSNPVLIKLYYKKNKLRKLRKNYGANFSDVAHYSITESLSNRYSLNKAEEHEQEVKKHGSKNKTKKENRKKKLLNFLYFALNILVIAVVLAIQLSSEPNPKDSITVILSANWWFLLCALLMFVITIIADQARCSVLMRKATGRFRINLSYKIVAVGRYYDVITPLSVGGQPFQVFYANKYGVKAGDGISVITAKYVFQQITYFIVVSYILFRNLFKHTLINSGVIAGSVEDGLVSTLSWIGYSVTAVVLFTLIFMALNKRVGSKLVAGIFKLFSKIKIGKFKVIKDYNKSFISTMKTVNSWQETTKKYFHSWWVILVNIIAALLCMFANYTIPFFIYCAFAGWQPEVWINIVTIAVMVELSSAFNPIPMGIGTADLGFKVLYGALFALAGVSTAFIWAYIIWRVLVYYIYIMQGLFIITYDYAIGNKKLAKYKDFWLLPFKERCKVKKDKFIKRNK